jgi:putative signal transducing protein
MERPDDLVSVYSTSDANEAEILRAALHDEGIRCEISGESQAGLTGITSMEIELLVRAEDYDRAHAFLENHHRPG